jgi:hypothetical protein
VICHHISPYERPHEGTKSGFLEKYTGGEYGDEKHKAFIHARALAYCKFSEGEKVKYKHKPALIEVICDNVKEVGWDGLTCLYIMISTKDEYTMVHHSALKRMGR